MIPLQTHPREEWTDADFELPEGDAIIISNPDADRDSDAWDFDIQDEAGSTLKPSRPSTSQPSQDDSGDVPTIKASAPSTRLPLEENIEDAFSLPPGLSRLSLPPLNHRISHTSLDWVDKDHTASSSTTSLSDTFTSLGFNPGASPSTSSHSTPGTKPEPRSDDDLEGLILPSTIFDSASAAKHLTRILEAKKAIPLSRSFSGKGKLEEHEVNFEEGLVINNDLDFSPGRLPKNRIRRDIQTSTHRKLASRASSSPNSSHERPWSPLKRVVTPVRSSSPAVTMAGCGQMQPDSMSLAPSRSTAQVRAQASLISMQSAGPRRKLKRKVSLPSFHTSLGKIASELSTSGVEPTSSTYSSSTMSSRLRVQAKTNLRYSQNNISGPDMAQASRPPSHPAPNLTLPSSFNRSRVRPALSSIFSNRPSSPPSTRTSPSPSVHIVAKPAETRGTRSVVGFGAHTSTSAQVLVPANALMRKPKRHRFYGDGTELDEIEDLEIDREQERQFRVTPQQATFRVPGGSYSPHSIRQALPMRSPTTSDGNNDSPGSKTYGSIPRRENKMTAATRKKPTLIRNLNGFGNHSVIGGMRWNAQSLKWDGNEHVLRDFDVATGNSTRPALITHLTGSSAGHGLAGIPSGVRIVGNMMFDPDKMCWLPKESMGFDEPDPFAGIDEEDEEGLLPRRSIDISTPSVSSTDPSSSISESESEPPPPKHSDQPHLSSSSSTFKDCCFRAAASHRQDIAGWLVSDSGLRGRLNYIRDLATKQY